ncbi:MAG TPA: flagellin [Verrucomicrobia bacterium]|nr:flagellin [Verrucomicrobiota bacterium]
MIVINTNTSAANASRLLSESSSQLSKSLARLSSGSKLVSPGDDAAGMAVSLRFDAQVNRIQSAKDNVGNAVSFAQTQDGFLSKVGKALDRMSELSVLAQDATKTDADRALYDKEFQTLDDYIVDIAGKDFNGVSLFSSTAMSVTTDSDANKFSMTGIDLAADADYTGLNGLAVGTTTGAASALTAVKAAITQLATDRATVGASVSRLDHTSDQLSVLKDNISAANSRIKDVDVAEESTQFARYNILVQSGTAMLAQANVQPQSALRLLG